MKTLQLFKIFGYIIIFSLIISCGCGKDIKITVHNDDQRDFFKNIILYNGYNVKIIDEDNYIQIKNLTMDMLLEIRNVLFLKMDIINNNINNVDTTRTENGGPYIRKYLKITKENGIEIVEDEERNFRIVYDPTHPDAITVGQMEGYVKYPNIDIISEMVELIQVNRFYDGITEYLKNNYKYVIF